MILIPPSWRYFGGRGGGCTHGVQFMRLDWILILSAIWSPYLESNQEPLNYKLSALTNWAIGRCCSLSCCQASFRFAKKQEVVLCMGLEPISQAWKACDSTALSYRAFGWGWENWTPINRVKADCTTIVLNLNIRQFNVMPRTFLN